MPALMNVGRDSSTGRQSIPQMSPASTDSESCREEQWPGGRLATSRRADV
jgi:hypothetical protein